MLEDTEFPLSEPEADRFAPLCKLKVKIKDYATDKSYDVEPYVMSSAAISISNTFAEWKKILQDHPFLIFDSCSPTQIDLVVETLQDLGEAVALVATGNANALSLVNADVGFALPTENTIDLSEEAADLILGNSASSRFV